MSELIVLLGLLW